MRIRLLVLVIASMVFPTLSFGQQDPGDKDANPSSELTRAERKEKKLEQLKSGTQPEVDCRIFEDTPIQARLEKSLDCDELISVDAPHPIPGAPQSPAAHSLDSKASITVGVPTNVFDFFASAQSNSQWCWAASIQMVLNYHNVHINQHQIVARTYGFAPNGQLPNWPGSFQAITKNLNNWSLDNSGRQYTVEASLNFGAPTPEVLLRELVSGHPVIVGYRNGPTAHAVVVTAASYTPSPKGPIINSVVARDPWPSSQNLVNSGRVEYPGDSFASLIEAYWYIRVY